MQSPSPKSQHETQAKKIMARRSRLSNNDRPAKEAVTPPAKEVVTPPAKEAVKEANKSKYAGISRKDLRLECDARGIVYKKKNTISELIAKLEA